jgi:hypothetical protein
VLCEQRSQVPPPEPPELAGLGSSLELERRAWATEAEAEAEAASGLTLGSLEMGVRHWLSVGVSVTRLASDTAQVVASSRPLQPRTLPLVMPEAARAEEARREGIRQQRMATVRGALESWVTIAEPAAAEPDKERVQGRILSFVAGHTDEQTLGELCGWLAGAVISAPEGVALRALAMLHSFCDVQSDATGGLEVAVYLRGQLMAGGQQGLGARLHMLSQETAADGDARPTPAAAAAQSLLAKLQQVAAPRSSPGGGGAAGGGSASQQKLHGQPGSTADDEPPPAAAAEEESLWRALVGPSAKEKAAARAQLEAEARMVFESVDGDGNGLLDAEELQTLVHRLGLQLSAAQIPQVLSMIDLDNSGEVDFEEFFSWYAENKDKRNFGLGGLLGGLFSRGGGSSSAQLVDRGVPAAPAAPELLAAGPSSISVSWRMPERDAPESSSPSTAVAEFELQYGGVIGTWKAAGGAPTAVCASTRPRASYSLAPSWEWTASALSSNKKYQVRVRARAAAAEQRPGPWGAWSKPLSTMTAAAGRAVGRAFPSCTRSILTEIDLCHACSCQEMEAGNALVGRRRAGLGHRAAAAAADAERGRRR